MSHRSSFPPPPGDPRVAVLRHGAARAVGRVERCCGPTFLVLRTTLVPPVGERVALRFLGELRLEAFVRWHERGALGLDLSSTPREQRSALRDLVGTPVSFFLQHEEVEGLALRLDAESAAVVAPVRLTPGLRVAMRVWSDDEAEGWHDRAMVVLGTRDGAIELVRQRSRWAEPAHA